MRRARPLVRIGAALVAAGLALLVLPAVSGAQEAPAEGAPDFGSYSLLARGAGFDFIFDTTEAPAHPAGQVAIPETVASLDTGPIGRGFVASVWPGPLAGNLGSLLVVAGGGQVPPEAEGLNSPIRAEANAPGGPPDAVLEPAPGLRMAAHAEEDLVTGDGSTSGLDLPGLASLRASATNTRVALEKGAGTSKATSIVEGVAFGPGGVVRIDTLTSVAEASTDGKQATSSGDVLVSGLTVAGVPVTIDEEGIRAGDTTSPNPIADLVNMAAQQALAGAGVTLTLTQPIVTKQGATASYTSGSLVLGWKPSDQATISLALGATTASVTAAPGFGVDETTGGTTGDATTGDATGDGGGTTSGDSGGIDLGGSPVPPVDTGGATGGGATTDGGVALPGGTGDGLAANDIGYGGLAPGALVLILGLALVAMGLLKRLPDEVLLGASTTCPLEGKS